MDDVFQFRSQLVERYSQFSRSFVEIAATDLKDEVERQYKDGRYWPEPLVQINPPVRPPAPGASQGAIRQELRRDHRNGFRQVLVVLHTGH
jgi:hypothetical protein